VDRGSSAADKHSTDGPTFSVVTVVFNDLQGLHSTRRSIEAQTFQAFEWIVVDGGSSDGTAEFLQNTPSPITRWISKPDSGIYDAMNRGIAMCSGKYVVFMNAGDYFPDKNTLGKVAAHLSARATRPDIIFGGATLLFRGGRRWYRPPKKMSSYIWHGLPAIHQATYYRRACLEEVRFDLTYRVCGDYYIAATLYQNGALASYIDESLADFTVGGTSFQSPRQLFIEPMRIQAKILHMGRLARATSVLKRLFATVCVALLHGAPPGRLSRPPR